MTHPSRWPALVILSHLTCACGGAGITPDDGGTPTGTDGGTSAASASSGRSSSAAASTSIPSSSHAVATSSAATSSTSTPTSAPASASAASGSGGSASTGSSSVTASSAGPSSTGSASASSSSSADTSTVSSSGPSSSSGPATTPDGCIILGAANILPDLVHAPASYNGDVFPALGGGASDFIRLEFYETADWTAGPGVYDLGSGVNTNYQTCVQCVRVWQDYDDAAQTVGKYFYQESGMMMLDTIHSPPSDNRSKGTITNVTLREAYLDSMGLLIADPAGPCVFVPSAAWDTTGP